jgi:acid phosphatase class B
MENFRHIFVIFAILSGAFALPSTKESGKRLIKFSEEEPAKWLSQEEIETMSLSGHKIHFIDITDRKYPSELGRVNTNGK